MVGFSEAGWQGPQDESPVNPHAGGGGWDVLVLVLEQDGSWGAPLHPYSGDRDMLLLRLE